MPAPAITGATIKFSDYESCYSVYRAIAEREFIVDIAYSVAVTHQPVPGEHLMVLKADDDGIVVCEYDDSGPYRNSTYHIGYDEIRSLTIR